MVLYEVNLSVDISIAKEFSKWLEPHIDQMLKIDGFLEAKWFEIADEKNSPTIV